ncbi:rhomboid family intramembrane serine protease [Sneathiella sp. HT1-7]|uniref:rhomboid family intramembrane serine protease n=1 Tax=Sneathiella sp. HT1-7 TaxID=2887192 RepID=UPI001D15799C|nr:rhomboid family intramembrane serine protease [Sneathiella sp. HT1-7]MCC3303217.1 rhomboid family intramembrane serine protease [Sneathiella sp. HT1-7]
MTNEYQGREPVFNVPPATMYMVAAIIGVHLLLTITTPETLNWVYSNFSFRPAIVSVLLEQRSLSGFLHIFITLNSHMFLHNDWSHMVLNAGMLLAFGTMTERRFGAIRFLILYFLSGWFGAFVEYLIAEPNVNITLYGASGAVFGAMGATMIVLLPRYRLRGVVTLIAVLLGINLVIGATPLGTLLVGPGVGIAWVAHLVGFAVGLVIAVIYSRKRVSSS